MVSGSKSGKAAAAFAVCLTMAIIAGGVALSLAPPVVAQSVVNVKIQGFAFSPSTITVVLGVNNSVQWTNLDGVIHTVTSRTNLFNMNMPPGQTFTYTFAAAGTYSYYCAIHTYMTGTVIVVASGTTTTTTSTSTSTASSASTTSAATTSTASSTASHTSATSVTTATSPTSTSTTSLTSTTTSAPRTTSSSSTTSSGYSSGGIPEFPFQGAAVAIVTVLVLASYLVARRTKKPGS